MKHEHGQEERRRTGEWCMLKREHGTRSTGAAAFTREVVQVKRQSVSPAAEAVEFRTKDLACVCCSKPLVFLFDLCRGVRNPCLRRGGVGE